MSKRIFWLWLFLASVAVRGQQMPRQNPAHHADRLTPLTAAGIKALAQGLLNSFNTDPNLTYAVRGKLDKMANTPTLNVAGTGVFYLSMGLPLDACGYLIAKGVLAHPGDPYAANGLGVYYRDSGSLVHSLQCYFYADNLLGKASESPYICANIAWASFYYGDWSTAQTYFTRALAISSSFQPAMEGNATLAYAKGDFQALFKCLSQELIGSFSTKTRTLSASGGGGPSTAFTSTCGGVMPDYGSDPTGNTTYDNLGSDDDGPDQDPPPGAPVTMPDIFRPVFVNSLKDVYSAMMQKTQVLNSATQIINGLKQQASGASLQPNGMTYIDEQGNIVHNHDYSKFLNLHAGIVQLLEQRIDWHIKKEYRPQLEQNYDNAAKQFGDMTQQMGQQISACGGNAGCVMQVYCRYTPQFGQVGSNFLDIGSSIWGQLYDKVYDELNWFLKNDAAIITRIHEPDANSALNADRELEVRVAILKVYSEYMDEVLGAASPFSMTYNTLSAQPLTCKVDARTIDAPDPFSKVPKHIKEFPDPNCQDMNFYMLVGSIVENCHTTTFMLGGNFGPVQAGIKIVSPIDPSTGKIKDPIYVQNNNFGGSYGGTLGLAATFGDVVQAGAAVSGSVTVNPQGKPTGYTAGAEASTGVDLGGATLGGKSSVNYQIDADWNVTGYSTGNTVTGSIGVTSAGPVTNGGMAATGGVSSTSNYDANGNYTGGTQSVTAAAQGTVAAGKAMSQGNIFGIQANQMIQVVAGQAQPAAPWSGGVQ